MYVIIKTMHNHWLNNYLVNNDQHKLIFFLLNINSVICWYKINKYSITVDHRKLINWINSLYHAEEKNIECEMDF